MLKVDILVRRNPAMTHDQFVAYWRDSHAKLFFSQPIVRKTVRRYLQSRTVADAPKGLNVADYDGIAQLWFDDMKGFLDYAQSDNYRDVIRIDEEKFTDPKRVELLFSEETSIIG
jgi:uncharacterized protein (TIGR02118 family)